MRTLALAAIAIGLAAPAMAQPVTSIDDGYGAAFPYTPRGGLVPVDTGQGLNAFFYPNGYDPQYGSQGRVADAADFAAGYGCDPVWDGKYGQYVAACNE